jgi:hypothetical protein
MIAMAFVELAPGEWVQTLYSDWIMVWNKPRSNEDESARELAVMRPLLSVLNVFQHYQRSWNTYQKLMLLIWSMKCPP